MFQSSKQQTGVTDMTTRTATEADVRDERSNAYADGGDMARAHMFDALSSGLTLQQADAYAREMIESASRAIVENTIGRAERRAAREAIRAKHNVRCDAIMANIGHKRLG
jgi:hypothetical protein